MLYVKSASMILLGFLACGCDEPADQAASPPELLAVATEPPGAARAGERETTHNDIDPGPVLTTVPPQAEPPPEDPEAMEEAFARLRRPVDPSDPLVPAAELTESETNALSEALFRAPSYAEDADPCEQAWSSYEHATRVSNTRRPASDNAALPRARFLDGCKSLPEALRPCLSIAYARDHRDECV